jgi:hypothetical protein
MVIRLTNNVDVYRTSFFVHFSLHSSFGGFALLDTSSWKNP